MAAGTSKARDTYLKRTYGISEQEYKQLLKLQKGVCYICGRPAKEGGRSLAVDHRHVRGEKKLPDGERQKLIRSNVRGLLDMSCNKGLAYYRDNPERLIRAAKYLKQPPAKKVLK